MERQNSRGGSERSYPASLYFCDELNQALNSGIGHEIVKALDAQEVNNTTEGLSNALIVRSFLFACKEELSFLNKAVIADGTPEGILKNAWMMAKNVDTLFDDTFLAEEASSEYAKLSGDEYFRNALVVHEGKARTVDARYIARVDLRCLDEPPEIYAEMEGLSNFIRDDLLMKAQVLYDQDATTDLVAVMLQTIDFHVGIIDEKLQNILTLA